MTEGAGPSSPTAGGLLSPADQNRLIRREVAAFLRGVPIDEAPIEDLEAAARLGLEEAAASYDPRLGVPFGAFARHRVRGAIRDTASDLYPHTRQNLEWLRTQLLVHEALTPKAIDPKNAREDEIVATMAQLRQLAVIATAEVVTAQPPGPTPEDAYATAQDVNALKKCIATLRRSDRDLIRAAFGLEGPKINASIYAKSAGLSRSQLSRRRAYILYQLRRKLGALLGIERRKRPKP